MIVIEPGDGIGLTVITDKSALSHGRTGGIAHHVIDTFRSVLCMISAVIIFFLPFLCIDIETILAVSVGRTHVMGKTGTEVFFKQTADFILPSFAKRFKVEVVKLFIGVIGRIINNFADKSMDMRIPFEITAESVERGNHTEQKLIFVISEKVCMIPVIHDLTLFLKSAFELAEELLIDDLAYGVSGSDEKKVKGRTIKAEIGSELFRDSEDDMSVRGIKTHGFGFGSEDLLLFGTAGSAEAGVTVAVNDIDVSAFRALENIIAQKMCVAEKGLLHILNYNRTAIAKLFLFEEPVIVVPQKLLDRWFVRIVMGMIAVINTMIRIFGIQRFIHTEIILKERRSLEICTHWF